MEESEGVQSSEGSEADIDVDPNVLNDENPDDPPDDPDNDDLQHDYESLLFQMSKKWYLTFLDHKVSITAAEEFWRISRLFWPKILQAKQEEGVTRKTPLFQNQRKFLDNRLCPDIHMEFTFLNIITGVVVKINSTTTPLKDYQRNPDYIKLYEEAHIQVRKFKHVD